MKKWILVIALILSPLAGQGYAQEDKLGVSLDLTYVSKWLSKGAEGYGQQGGLFKTLCLDFYNTGWGMKVTHRNALGSGYVNKERFDYRLYYKNKFFQDEPYTTNYNISLGYEHYPDLAKHKANTTFEWVFAFSWPNICPLGMVPAYVAHYEYPASGGDTFNHITGWVHRFMLGYDFNVPELPAPLHLSTEVAYTDGLGGKEHDWSYFTTGLSTTFRINDDLCFVPGVYHQFSMEDSVNDSDVTYAMVSMKYTF